MTEFGIFLLQFLFFVSQDVFALHLASILFVQRVNLHLYSFLAYTTLLQEAMNISSVERIGFKLFLVQQLHHMHTGR